MAWQAKTYLAFGDHRTRPSHDLIARIPIDAPRLIYDLGCGPGNSTRALARRWPEARLIGVDNAPDMLATARRSELANAEWLEGDVQDFSPPEPGEILFSNAVFQWLDGQDVLLPRLMEALPPGGALAFQIPANHDVPPHTIIDEALEALGLGGKVSKAALSRRVFPPAWYYRLLAPMARHLDIWDTEYLQVMEGESPIISWVKGTALLPVMAALDDGEAARFLPELERRFAAHYPPESDGRTLFPFRRRFIVAVRA